MPRQEAKRLYFRNKRTGRTISAMSDSETGISLAHDRHRDLLEMSDEPLPEFEPEPVEELPEVVVEFEPKPTEPEAKD